MTDERSECCETCRFWLRTDGSEGECHRYPPTVLSLEDPSGYYPETFESEWCGEWRVKDAPPAAPAYDTTPRDAAWWHASGLSVRTRKAILRRFGGVWPDLRCSVADVAAVPFDEWLGMKNFGVSSLNELRDWLVGQRLPSAGSDD